MSMKNILTDAIRVSRNRFGLKSSNKIYVNTNYCKNEMKKRLYSSYSHQIRKRMLGKIRQGVEYLSLEEKYQKILKTRFEYFVGNCSEYCIVAFYYLLQRKQDILNELKSSCTIEFIETCSQYDHTFILIVPVQGNTPRYLNSEFRFNHLPPDSWVCDPWANIACEARYYSLDWRLKMEKWSNKTKHITGIVKNGIAMAHLDPRDDLIYKFVEEGRKKIAHTVTLIYHSAPKQEKGFGGLLTSLNKDDIWP